MSSRKQKANRKTRRKHQKILALGAKAGDWGRWEKQDFAAADALLAGLSTSGVKRLVRNDCYSVQFYEHRCQWGKIEHLVVRRHDQGKRVPWAHKQRIKDELVGEDKTAIEVFPSKENLVDQENLYHLWVLPDDFELPFGLHKKGWARDDGLGMLRLSQ